MMENSVALVSDMSRLTLSLFMPKWASKQKSNNSIEFDAKHIN